MHTKFSDFAGESRRIDMSSNDFHKRVEAECTVWNGRFGSDSNRDAPGRLYRRVRGTAPFQYIEPMSSSPRTSIEDEQVHITILSNFPSWEGWPPYDHSVIGSTAYVTSGYSNSTYEVIPTDGARVAVCPNRDVWTSLGGYGATSRISVINNLIYLLGLDETSDTLYDDLYSINDCDGIVKESHEYRMFKYALGIDDEDPIPSGGALANRIDKLFSPESNGFELLQYDENFSIDDERQFWISEPCYLMRVL